MSTPLNPDDFKRFTDQAYSQWEQAMTGWWDQILDSPDFLGASGKGLAAMALARKDYEAQVDQQLTRMHLPTRTDLTRLARIATLLEDRLLQMEDTVLELKDLLQDRQQAMQRMEKEVVQARVEAAEARIELREHLAALQQRLATLESANSAAPAARPGASAGATPSRRGRKPGQEG